MKSKIFLLMALAGFVSCTDLTETAESNLTSNQFYRNGDDAVAAVNAIYAGLNPTSNGSLYNGLQQIGVEMATDDYEAGPRARNSHVRAISGLTHDASNDRMQELWRLSYDLINRANIAIDRIAAIGSANISDELRARTINEAKFLRALNYFNLIRWFGYVPIVLHETTELTPEKLYVEQAHEDSVYAQIVRDLKDAEALPAPSAYSANDLGRATSGAAKALLAWVYLTHKDWALAKQKSQEVIQTGWYDLFDNYADVFNVATENGKENIFSVQFKGNFNFIGNFLAARSAPNEVPGINGDYGDALHTAGGLYTSFSNTDTRKAVTFITSMVSPTNGQTYTFVPHFHKYYDASVVGNQTASSKDLHVLRYPDVLFIFAEASNELTSTPSDSAYWALDKVRTRSHVPTTKSLSPSLSTVQFRDSVFQERRKEFVYEYKRWFDLSRRGATYFVNTLKAAGKTNAAPRHVHFPVPQRELDLNPKLHQNPDWLNY